MGVVSSWLLSIACVVVLSVLAEFVLPEGQINKYIKVIFSFVILLVIIMPLPKLFGKEFELRNLFENNQSQLQEDYLYQVNLNKLNSLSEDIDRQILEAGMDKVVVSINSNIMSQSLEIFGVYVDIKDIKFLDKFGSPDKTKAKLKINEILDGFSILKGVEVKFNEN